MSRPFGSTVMLTQDPNLSLGTLKMRSTRNPGRTLKASGRALSPGTLAGWTAGGWVMTSPAHDGTEKARAAHRTNERRRESIRRIPGRSEQARRAERRQPPDDVGIGRLTPLRSPLRL